MHQLDLQRASQRSRSRLLWHLPLLMLAGCSSQSPERTPRQMMLGGAGGARAATGGALAVPALGSGGAGASALGTVSGGSPGLLALGGSSNTLGGSSNTLGGSSNTLGGSLNTVSVGGTGGSGGSLNSNAGGASPLLPSGELTWVAVGYAGRRIRSVDLGKTWQNDQTLGGGVDDEFLLRGVGFAKGLFVALGYQIHSSKDGITWQRETNPQHQWLQGIVFPADRFVATGGYGYSAYSLDGHDWKVGGDLMTEASRSLALGGGVCMTATDAGNWWRSTDGMNWTKESGGHQTGDIAYCGGQFSETKDCTGRFSARSQVTLEGVTLRTNNGKVERSENGLDFQAVVESGPALIAVTAGYVVH